MIMIYFILSDVFYSELSSKYAVNVAKRRVDFILPKKPFPCSNIVFELLQD